MTTIPARPADVHRLACPTEGCTSTVRFAFDTTRDYVTCRVSGHVNPTPDPDPTTT